MVRCLIVVLLSLTTIARAPIVSAQDAPQKLIEKRPYDMIKLKENGGTIIYVEPIKFPDRQIPKKPKPSDKIKVRPTGEDGEYEVQWSDIEKVVLYEKLVLDELEAFTKAGKFDDAYDYLDFMLRNYPKAEGLDEVRQEYLFAAAGDAFRRQQLSEALGIAEELLRLNPEYSAGGGRTLIAVVGSIVDKMVEKYVEAKDFRSARAILLRIAKQYRAEKEALFTKWSERLGGEALEHRDAARTALEEKRFVDAYDAWARMEDVWPLVEGAAELTSEMERQYPLIRVAVTQPPRDFVVRHLGDQAARRAGRLVDRTLLEFVGAGTEGGKYVSPWGSWEKSDDSMLLSLKLGADVADVSLTGYDFARRLSELADRDRPGYSTAWARLIGGIRVQNVQRVEMELLRPHVLPEAFLTLSMRSETRDLNDWRDGGQGPFTLFAQENNQTRYVRNAQLAPTLRPKLAEIVERRYDDVKRSLLALKRGEVDALDQVFPGDIAELRGMTDVTVANYELAHTHLLVPCKPHPYFANRNFRRALVAGLNREQILGQAIYQGGAPTGAMVVSAPFLAPMRENDPRAYGYNSNIAPRAFDARLALALRLLTGSELQVEAKRKEAAAPALEPIVLGHPADEVSRIASRAIEAQWKIIGVPVKLVEFPPGVFYDESRKCHLIYVTTGMWEPLVDARRLLSQPDVEPLVSTHILNTLRQIDSAKNWREARERLLELHRLLHEELPVLPLWQTVDAFAYRQRLRGIVPGAVSFYQGVEGWNITSSLRP